MAAKFPRLTQFLESTGEVSPQVDRLMIAKIGCAGFLPSKQPESASAFPISEREEQQNRLSTPGGSIVAMHGSTFPGIYPEIIKALEKHQNVFDLSVKEKSTREIIRPLENGWLISGELFSLRVKLPARLQKAAWYIEDRAPPIEEFEVISRGSLFAAFATVEDFGLTIIGSEYRTLLEGQIKSESTLGWVPFGPVPIHPDFYLAFRKRESDGKPGPLKTFSRGNDVILLIDDPSFTDQELMAALFESLAPVMTDFYAMVLQQSLLGDYQQEISNQFLVLSRAIGQLHETPQWRIPTFRGTVDTARGSLSIIHIRYVNFETELFEYDNSRRDFLGRVRDHSILAKIAGYFERETEPGYQVTQSMIHALRHFEEDLSTSLNLRGILLAALVGVVGVVTGVVLQTALRLFSN